MSKDSREAILQRVRTGVGRADFAARRQAAEAWLAARQRGPQPRLPGDLVRRFREQAEALASTVETVATWMEVPAAVARYLMASGESAGFEAQPAQAPLCKPAWMLDLQAMAAAGGEDRPAPSTMVVAPELAGLAWAEAGLPVAARGAVDADRVGITGCFCAIAETGSLLLLSGPDSPATVSLLPETHVAVVPVGRIVATLEDAFALVRAERGALPRALNFISGPSRTGDIEQTIVLGAHGPCRVHMILVEGKARPGADNGV